MNPFLNSKYADHLPEQINNKSILITGGTTGIGRATAILLAALGNNVFIAGRHQAHLDDALADHKKVNGQGRLTGITADLATEEGIAKVFEAYDKAFNKLDILINNVALSYEGIEKGNYKDWAYILNTNLLCYLTCSRAAVDRMKIAKSGHIINIGSMSANQRGEDSSVYVASKAGVQGFNESLRKEVNDLGIKVTLIEPGRTGTDMQPEPPAKQQEKEADLEMLTAEDIAAGILYALSNPKRCDVVSLQIMPYKQMI